MIEPCERCGGSGEIQDMGWQGEYPEYCSCPECGGSGSDYEPDPDEKFERIICAYIGIVGVALTFLILYVAK